ncbi:MAG: carbohydrate binding domain-containing protein [Frankiaceae bacterium]
MSKHSSSRARSSRPSSTRRLLRWYAAIASVVSLVIFATPSFASLTAHWSSGPVNLVQNPDFETGTTAGWRTNSAAERLSIVASSHSGSHAVRLTTTKLTTAVLNDKTNTVASTVAGTTYQSVAWVRTATPNVSGTLRLREVRNGAQVGKGHTDFTLRDTAWHEVQLSYQTRSTGAALDLNVVGWNLATSDDLRVDDVQLVAASSASPAGKGSGKPGPSPTTTSPAPAPTTTSPAPEPTTTTPAPEPTTTTPAPEPTTTTPAPAPSTTSSAPSSGSCTVSAILVPSCGAWWGVAPNPLSGETWDQALVNFESTMGRTVGIAHYYHRGTQLFPSAKEIARAREPGKRRLLLENWRPENGYSWAQVANGAVDGLIDQEAAYVKANFSERFFLAIHGEPEDEVIATSGSGYTAGDFRAMFRHVVLRLRADGVTNAVSVVDYTGNPKWGSASWFDAMYPGNDVVDWLAEDPYIIGPEGGWYDNDYGHFVNRTFPNYSFPGFYAWAGNIAPGKPIMISEWGVDDLSTDPSWKPGKFKDIATHAVTDYPLVKALVYWNSNAFNPVGTTRIDSSSASLDAYRQLSHVAVLNPPVPTS